MKGFKMNLPESQFIDKLKSDLAQNKNKLAEARAKHAASPSNKTTHEVSNCVMTVALLESALKDIESATNA